MAIALNGGVSLAVWMGGCAVELDRARRASEKQDPKRVYDALCHCLGRRLVIDVLTGTSAGGINGALLGAAIAKDRQLDPEFIRGRWIELGDLSAILHDSAIEKPTALMDGKKFYKELVETFEGVLGTNPKAPGYDKSTPSIPAPWSGTPFLDVTMTDVLGVERRFRDSWGAELVARDHQPRFRFREDDHYTPEALAGAARTSASFPIAFDPWKVEGGPRALAGLPGKTWGIDGGLLNNAPIREALELIPGQPAGSLVRRYFCYINADPTPPSETTIGGIPSLSEVGRYIVNLPRSAPLVNHLYAIRAAVERPKRAAQVQDQLLEMSLDHLAGVATSLFDAYRKRRTLESLEELVDDQSEAATMFDLLEETKGDLPWIPRRLVPGPGATWEWGVRPAQRILHLILDILRPAIEKAKAEDRIALLKCRLEIDKQLTILAGARVAVTTPEAIRSPSRFELESTVQLVNKAGAAATDRAPEACAAVTEAAEILDAAMGTYEGHFDAVTREALFGTTQAGDPARIQHFLQRVLSIEVVRRAFASEAEIDSAQELCFVQLTPEAPSPIFTSHPLRLSSPASAAEKLTGVGLGHFAGFYRRSWRANDYMWGRLDAATRIVDLLLDAPCKDVGTGAGSDDAEERARTRAEELAVALVESVGTDLWAVEEVLADHEEIEEESGELLERLQGVIAAELLAVEKGMEDEEKQSNPTPVTRALFQRAAQLEVLREELPELLEESKEDRARGSMAAPLELGGPAGTPTKARVEAIRDLYLNGSSLPKKLSDPGEPVSTLGLQTITHAAFVGLSAIRTAGLPMSKFLGLVRPPLLAVAGSVATNVFSRLTVVIGFWAASLYLASRILTTENIAIELSSVWSWAMLTALVAAIGAAGVALVPGLRAWRKVHPARNWLFVALILLPAGLVAAGLAIVVGNLDIERVIFAPGADPPPRELLLAVLIALGVVSLTRFPLKGPLKLVGGLLRGLRSGPWTWLLPLLAFIALGVASGITVGHAVDEGWWQAVAAFTALIGAPAAGLAAVTVIRRG